LNGELKTDTGSEMIAAQGMALHTKYRAKKKSLKKGRAIECTLCPRYDEKTDHIITVPNTGKRQNIKQYDKVYIQLHSVIHKQTGVKLDKQHGYEQVTSEYTSHKSSLGTKTNTTVKHDNPETSSLIVEMEDVNRYCCFRDRDVIKTEAGKIFKMSYNRDVAYAEYTNETHTHQ